MPVVLHNYAQYSFHLQSVSVWTTNYSSVSYLIILSSTDDDYLLVTSLRVAYRFSNSIIPSAFINWEHFYMKFFPTSIGPMGYPEIPFTSRWQGKC